MNESLKYAVGVADEVARCFTRAATEASAEALGSIDNAFILAAAMEAISALMVVLRVYGIILDRGTGEGAR